MADSDMKSGNSDLATRVQSAIVMIAVAGTALWLGGWWWTGFVAIIAIGVLWEWQRLVSGFKGQSAAVSILWRIFGVIYILLAANALAVTRVFQESGLADAGFYYVLLIIGAVIAVDIGAYFFGRTLGGPKIAPSISPNKTWAGLLGGCIGATIVITGASVSAGTHWSSAILYGWIAGILVAVCAQAGDFFESWMKRRAGVKDSSKLIPGHGGLFDRVDGLLAVSFVLGAMHGVVRILAS